jgi:predicted DNA binding CopG/RHH family protein
LSAAQTFHASYSCTPEQATYALLCLYRRLSLQRGTPKRAQKKLPTFESDRAAERFVESADLSEYDLSGGQFVRFEMKPKNASVNLRLPKALLDALRKRAGELGIAYQRLIRLGIKRFLKTESRR